MPKNYQWTRPPAPPKAAPTAHQRRLAAEINPFLHIPQPSPPSTPPPTNRPVVIDLRSRTRSRTPPRANVRTVPSYHDTRQGDWHPPYQWWSVDMIRQRLGPCPPAEGPSVWSSRFFECDCYGTEDRCTQCNLRMCNGCRFRWANNVALGTPQLTICVLCAWRNATLPQFRRAASFNFFCYNEAVRLWYDEFVPIPTRPLNRIRR
jgi:hypothetical protein